MFVSFFFGGGCLFLTYKIPENNPLFTTRFNGNQVEFVLMAAKSFCETDLFEHLFINTKQEMMNSLRETPGQCHIFLLTVGQPTGVIIHALF